MAKKWAGDLGGNSALWLRPMGLWAQVKITACGALAFRRTIAAMSTMQALLAKVTACQHCAAELPLGPRPVLITDERAVLLIIGQAPGTRVHNSGIPWNDPSGDRLRSWLGIDREQFYNDPRIAIMPMGFCYPGKGKSGDMPPRPECAPLWHQPLTQLMPNIELVLLIGQYAQRYYLHDKYSTLTERVQRFSGTGRYFPLPHPSPRNQLWRKRNPWFEEETVPVLRRRVTDLLEQTCLK